MTDPGPPTLIAPSSRRSRKALTANVFARSAREPEIVAKRHRSADDDAVDLAVGQLKLTGSEDRVDEELTAQAGGIERLRVVAVNRLTDVHGRFGAWRRFYEIELATPRRESSLARWQLTKWLGAISS